MSTTQTVKKNYALPIAMMYLLFFMIAFVTNRHTSQEDRL